RTERAPRAGPLRLFVGSDPVGAIPFRDVTSIDQVRARVSGLGPAERDRFWRRLGGVGRIDDPERRRRVLGYIERDLIRAEEARTARRRAIPAVLAYPDDL